jgi:hypothetical protein
VEKLFQADGHAPALQQTATPGGRYLQIETTLQIHSGDVSPILYDLTVLVARPPNVIPEMPWGTIAASLAMLAALISYFVVPKLRRTAPTLPRNWR